MQTTKVIYSMKVAIQLKDLGHKIVMTMPNPNDNKLICWVFEKDQSFDSDLSNIIERRKKHG